MVNFKTLFSKGSFSQDIFKVATGTVFAQVISFAVTPVLTRLFSPEVFGISTVYLSIVAIIAINSCLNFEWAIVLPEDESEAVKIVIVSLLFNFIISSITLVFFIIWGKWLLHLINAPGLYPYVWLIPLSVFLQGIINVVSYWVSRKKEFGITATGKMADSVISSGYQLGFGFAGVCTAGVRITSGIAGQIATIASLSLQCIYKIPLSLKQSISLHDIRYIIFKYRRFPLYSSWSSILNSASSMLPSFMLNYFFSAAVVGQYALGYRTISLPMTIIGSSVAQAFFPRASEAKRAGTLDKIVLSTFKKLLSLGFTPLILLSIVAPDMFGLLFGHAWVDAGRYIRWLAIWILFLFISSPISSVYSVQNKQSLCLIYNISIFIARFVVLFVTGKIGNPDIAIAAFGLTGALLYITNCTIILRICGVSAGTALLQIVKQFLFSAGFILVPLILTVFHFPLISLGVTGIVMVVFCIMMLNRISPDKVVYGSINY